MSIIQSEFLHSVHARASLKRGIARQAMRFAVRDQADLRAIYDALAQLRPNRKALERAAQRLMSRKGVVRVTIGQGCLTVIARNQVDMTTAADGTALFSETALIYTRITSNGVRCKLGRASFNLHALERLVERGSAPLDLALLPQIDVEAVAILLAKAQIDDDDDVFIAGVATGVWAGSVDEMPAEDDWLPRACRIPVFSARTFLGPEEMRPMVWLRWSAAA